MKPNDSKMPPCDLDAERSVLRAAFVDNAVVDEALAELRSEDFYSENHRLTFSAMVELHNAGRQFDVLILADELERLGRLDQIGGREFLIELFSDKLVTEVWHVRYHARLIREAAQRRRVIQAARELEADAYNHQDVDELLAKFDHAHRQLSEREESRTCLSMLEVLHKRRDSLQQNNRGQVPTGWSDLDELLGGGLRAGSLVIVGARPSVGKTSAALGMALSAAQAGMPALFVSLEQSQIVIANRLLCAMTGLPFAEQLTQSIAAEVEAMILEQASPKN